jgi:hypothetical protein
MLVPDGGLGKDVGGRSLKAIQCDTGFGGSRRDSAYGFGMVGGRSLKAIQWPPTMPNPDCAGLVIRFGGY